MEHFNFIKGNGLPVAVDLNSMTTIFLRKVMGNIGSCAIWPSSRATFTEFSADAHTFN